MVVVVGWELDRQMVWGKRENKVDTYQLGLYKRADSTHAMDKEKNSYLSNRAESKDCPCFVPGSKFCDKVVLAKQQITGQARSEKEHVGPAQCLTPHSGL